MKKPLALLLFGLPPLLVWLNGFIWQLAGFASWIPQFLAGAILLLGLVYASGNLYGTFVALWPLPEEVHRRHTWLAWLSMAYWTSVWFWVWITLPAGYLLKLLIPPVFFILAWSSLNRTDDAELRWRAILGWTLVGLLTIVIVVFLASDWRRERLFGSLFGPLELSSKHYLHGQVLKAWNTFEDWGPAGRELNGLRLNSPAMGLVKWMGTYGTHIGILLAAALPLFWLALWQWIACARTSSVFSPQRRRLTQALVALHAIATSLYVLFSVAVIRIPLVSGLPPLTRESTWWLPGTLLAWLIVQAWRSHRGHPRPVDSMPQWIRLAIYAMALAIIAWGLLFLAERRGERSPASARMIQTTRAAIHDSEGKVIAENVPAYDLWFIARDFWKPSLLNPRLALEREEPRADSEREERLLSALSAWPSVQAIARGRLTSRPKSEDLPAILAWAVTPDIASAVRALQMPGVWVKKRPARHYPEGTLYAHALGFVGLDDMRRGQEGLELAANDLLLANASGSMAPPPIVTTFKPGIQRAAREVLSAGVEEFRATGGAIVVIDLAKDSIAAMVSAPDFDPNKASSYRNPHRQDLILNRATSLSFPMGSLLAPLIVAHGIESERFTLHTRVNISETIWPANSQHVEGIADATHDESLSVREIVARSNTLGLTKLISRMPQDELQSVYRTLGLGGELGIPGLTGVIAEKVAREDWTQAMQAQPGRHVKGTLMQALKAYLPIANDGFEPRLRVIEPGEAGRFDGPPYPRVLSPTTASAVRDMLVLAVSSKGTASNVQVPGIPIAGKTSSMRSAAGDTVAFIGMLPVERPQWLVGIVLEFSPGRSAYAGSSAASMFSRLVRQALVPADS